MAYTCWRIIIKVNKVDGNKIVDSHPHHVLCDGVILGRFLLSGFVMNHFTNAKNTFLLEDPTSKRVAQRLVARFGCLLTSLKYRK